MRSNPKIKQGVWLLHCFLFIIIQLDMSTFFLSTFGHGGSLQKRKEVYSFRTKTPSYIRSKYVLVNHEKYTYVPNWYGKIVFQSSRLEKLLIIVEACILLLLFVGYYITERDRSINDILSRIIFVRSDDPQSLLFFKVLFYILFLLLVFFSVKSVQCTPFSFILIIVLVYVGASCLSGLSVFLLRKKMKKGMVSSIKQ